MTTTILSREFIEAFGDDDMTDAEIREFCVGNSHALVVAEYSSTSARCACGSTLTLLANGRWVHGSTKRVACPPYECECGRRH
jgi:hypothetical protein